MARRVAVQLGWDNTPATTVNRFCASSTQTARMAFHAIKAGEGDIFVSPPASSASRGTRTSGRPGSATRARSTRSSPTRCRATEKYAETNDTWHDPRADGLIPDIYIAMGQTAENVATLRGITRAEQDAFGVRSQNLAEKAIDNGVLRARDHPGDAAGRDRGEQGRRTAGGHDARGVSAS